MSGNFSDYDKSQYLNAAAAQKLDLPLRVTIGSIAEELVRDPKSGQQVPKLVVHFDELEDDQGLILNKTNLRSLRNKFGDEIAAAIGKAVILFVGDTQMGPGIRLRFPETKKKGANTNVEKFAKDDGNSGSTSIGDEIDDAMPI
jgi:hypothetical protein